MAKFEVELDDATGKPTGALPDAVQKFIDGKFSEGFGKGSSKAAAEAQAQIDKALADAKANGSDPLQAQKVATLEKDAARLREEIAKRDGDWAGQLKARQEQEAIELKARDERIAALHADNEKRTARLKELAKNEIKAAALKHGALDTAVDDLAALLASQIGLDGDLQWFVLDTDGKSVRLGEDKKPVTVEGLVQKTLTDKPFFKAAGGSRVVTGGGRSLSTGTRPTGTVEAALADAEVAPTSANLGKAMGAILDRSRTH